MGNTSRIKTTLGRRITSPVHRPLRAGVEVPAEAGHHSRYLVHKPDVVKVLPVLTAQKNAQLVVKIPGAGNGYIAGINAGIGRVPVVELRPYAKVIVFVGKIMLV